MSADHDPTFASDNTAGIAPEAWAALAAANAGAAPSYGEDDWTARARRLVAELFATDCEVFFVFNGTAANALALAQVCRGHHAVFCHELAHVQTDECGAPEFFTGGSKLIPVPGADAKVTPGGLARALAGRRDVHFPKPGALSLTQATEWGTVYAPGEVRALAAIAREHGMAVHVDGARFANAAANQAAHGVSPADLTWRAGVDVLCLGGTKNGLNSTEAVVFFDRDRARDFAYKVKQAGQLASKARFAAAQWCGMLADGAWLRHAAHANVMARRLADGLRALPPARLIAEPAANGVFVELPPRAVSAVEARGWHFHRFVGEHGYRFMCSWATTPAQVDRLLADLRAALG
ncbi:MAG TPA: low specificity L-threonine aldolase [Opitutaceae bacterium]|nr:low specificity L-threonine aldolase [Opitutaceae bacterium]